MFVVYVWGTRILRTSIMALSRYVQMYSINTGGFKTNKHCPTQQIACAISFHDLHLPPDQNEYHSVSHRRWLKHKCNFRYPACCCAWTPSVLQRCTKVPALTRSCLRRQATVERPDNRSHEPARHRVVTAEPTEPYLEQSRK